MGIDNKNTHEADRPADQVTLRDITTICEAETGVIQHDNIAYLRAPATTILVHDNREKPAAVAKGLVGDFEVWRLDWLNKGHLGYGPHTLTIYKFFVGDDKIRAKRLLEQNETNGDPREEAIEREEPTLPAYLTDEDPELALIKQSLEGLPTHPRSTGSPEQQIEAINRFFGGDPEETALGLHDLSQGEADGLRRLLLTAEPTRDPYFES